MQPPPSKRSPPPRLSHLTPSKNKSPVKSPFPYLKIWLEVHPPPPPFPPHCRKVYVRIVDQTVHIRLALLPVTITNQRTRPFYRNMWNTA